MNLVAVSEEFFFVSTSRLIISLAAKSLIQALTAIVLSSVASCHYWHNLAKPSSDAHTHAFTFYFVNCVFHLLCTVLQSFDFLSIKINGLTELINLRVHSH